MSDESLAADLDPDDSAELLDVLGDECARRILSATKAQPMTAKQLSDHCPVSTTTIYRRINTLLDCGLVREEAAFPTDGAGMKFYEPTFDFLEVTLDNDGLRAETFDSQSAVERAVRLFDEAPTDDVEVEVTDGELRLSIPFTNELVGDLAAEATPERSIRYNGDR